MDMKNAFESKIHTVLVDNILLFWKGRAFDIKSQLPFGKIDKNGLPISNEPIGTILTAGMLWAFSAAYEVLKVDEYLKMAQVLKCRLLECFWDQSNGGLWNSINSDKSVYNPDKYSNCQAYGIYALCAYYNSSKDKNALKYASALFEFVEKYKQSGHRSSYPDLLYSIQSNSRLGLKEKKDEFRSLNTHTHLLKAYNFLYQCTGDTKIKKRLQDLFDLLADYFYFDGLFYTNLSLNLYPIDKTTSYGMNLETAWLLIGAAESLGKQNYIRKAHSILTACASKTLAVAIDDDGGVFYDGMGCRPRNFTKYGWAQAESTVAFLIAYEKSLKQHYFDAFLMTWNFIFRYLIDWKIGEWRIGVTKQLNVLEGDYRVGFQKCPYHNTRACIEALKRVKLINYALDICSQKESLEDCLEPSLISGKME
jgi:mannobiose 2-epimerase